MYKHTKKSGGNKKNALKGKYILFLFDLFFVFFSNKKYISLKAALL